MARTTLTVTVGTVLTNGDVAPLLAAPADPNANLVSAAAYISATLYGLTSTALTGLTTVQINGLVSTQMAGLTTAQTAVLAAQAVTAKDVVLTYDATVVSSKNTLLKCLDRMKLLVQGRDDLT